MPPNRLLFRCGNGVDVTAPRSWAQTTKTHLSRSFVPAKRASTALKLARSLDPPGSPERGDARFKQLQCSFHSYIAICEPAHSLERWRSQLQIAVRISSLRQLGREFPRWLWQAIRSSPDRSHSGNPASRNPSANRAKSSGRWIGNQSFRLETRKDGSSSCKRCIACFALSMRPLSA